MVKGKYLKPLVGFDGMLVTSCVQMFLCYSNFDIDLSLMFRLKNDCLSVLLWTITSAHITVEQFELKHKK